jgi:2-dehydropantoate 2-reductase
MKIAIIGTGAMGSVYAGILGDAGNDVWAVDTWRAHVEAIRAQGLTVDGASGHRTVSIDATTEPNEVGMCDMVVIATKARDVETAARTAAPMIGPDTVVVPIQNGVGSIDRITAILGDEQVVIGVVGGFGASMVAPGHVHHNGWEFVRFGERHGPVSERLRRVARVWEHAGFRVQLYDDLDQLVWEKLIANVGFSGTCAVLELTIGEVVADPAAWSVAAACACEAYEVARARGITVGFDDPVAYLREFGGKIPGARPSMLLDVLSGQPTEVDVINGAVPVAARAVGLAAPVNETITSLVKAKNRPV